MKLRTHYVFSFGLLFLIDSLITNTPFYYLLILTGVISVVANNVIDSLGHEVKGKYIARIPRTHTVPRSIGWGLLTTLPIAVMLYYFYPKLLYVTILDGLIVGPSHTLLDVFTEKGIYHKVNGRWRRFALAHFSYNDPFVNGLATFLGFIMLFTVIYIHG